MDRYCAQTPKKIRLPSPLIQITKSIDENCHRKHLANLIQSCKIPIRDKKQQYTERNQAGLPINCQKDQKNRHKPYKGNYPPRIASKKTKQPVKQIKSPLIKLLDSIADIKKIGFIHKSPVRSHSVSQDRNQKERCR